MSTPVPSAICGSRPIVTNSVVPMAKPPTARARIARVVRRAAGLTGGLRVWSCRRPGRCGGCGRIAVDPDSDPNGNGPAATVIPMPTTIERLLGRLRGLVRGAPKPPTRPSETPGPRAGRQPAEGSAPPERGGPEYPGDATSLPDTKYAPSPDGRPDP